MHLDIGLQIVETHHLFPYFLEKHLAIPTTSFFSFTSKWFAVIYICMWTKKILNRSVIDSRFQTLAVGLLVEFIN